MPSEYVAISKALEPKEKEKAKERQGTRTNIVESYHNVKNNGKTRDKLAKKIGVSGRTLERAAEVVESRDKKLIDDMDRTRRVNR